MLTIAELDRIRSDHTQHCRERFYLLADHSGLPDLARTLRASGVAWTNLFGDDRRPSLTAASPLLFEVNLTENLAAKRQLLTWLEENGKNSSSLLLISSPLPLKELACGLSRRCDGILSDGEAIIIRYFDTRVFPQLLNVMNDEEKSAWLGIATGWWFMGRDGATVHVASQVHANDIHNAPLKISDSQLAQLLQESEPDEIAYLLENNLSDHFRAMEPAERYRLTREKLLNGREIGLTQLSDLALYCSLAFLHSPGFDTEPKWKAALARVKAKELSLQEAIESIEQTAA